MESNKTNSNRLECSIITKPPSPKNFNEFAKLNTDNIEGNGRMQFIDNKTTPVCSIINCNSGKTDNGVEGKCPICYDSKELQEKFKCSHLVCNDCFKNHLKSEGIKIVCGLCRSSVNEECLDDEEKGILNERKSKSEYNDFHQILRSMFVNVNGIDGVSGNGQTNVPSYVIEEVFRQVIFNDGRGQIEDVTVHYREFTADRN